MTRTLSYPQQIAVQQVHTLNLAKRAKRAEIEQRIRDEVAAELAEIEREESRAAHRALSLGVSKATIGRDGLHTRDPYAITRVLEVAGEPLPPTMFRVLTEEERAKYRIGPDEVAAAVEYPTPEGTLSGLVVREDDGAWGRFAGDAGLDAHLSGGLAVLLDAWAR